MAETRLGKGESPQIHTRTVVGMMLGLLAMVIVVAFGLALFFPNRIGIRFVPRNSFPAPAVVPDERAERIDLELRQRRALNGAGGRLPITRAMQAVASRGSHAFDPVEP